MIATATLACVVLVAALVLESRGRDFAVPPPTAGNVLPMKSQQAQPVLLPVARADHHVRPLVGPSRAQFTVEKSDATSLVEVMLPPGQRETTDHFIAALHAAQFRTDAIANSDHANAPLEALLTKPIEIEALKPVSPVGD